jgi:radical SAM protein (TIGR01212 family)
LKERYDTVKKFKDIVGISIGTRPDCVNKEILDLIESYTRDYEVWMEYGLQSIHNKSLKYINRGHSYQDFLKTLTLTRKRKGIKVCAHIILGLPGETRKDIMATAGELGRLKLDGVKIHPLHIIKGTKLEEQFKKGLYAALQFEEYTGLVSEFLEYLCPDTVIQRLTADCPKELLAAPDWVLQKGRVLGEIDRALIKEGRFQGRRYTG